MDHGPQALSLSHTHTHARTHKIGLLYDMTNRFELLLITLLLLSLLPYVGRNEFVICPNNTMSCVGQ
jgi:hypothetical protein